MPDPFSNNGMPANTGAPAPVSEGVSAPITQAPVAPVAPAAPSAASPAAEPQFNPRDFFSQALEQQRANAPSQPGSGPTAPVSPTSPAAPQMGTQAPISATSPRAILDRLQTRGFNPAEFADDDALLEAIEASVPKLRQLSTYEQQLAWYQSQLGQQGQASQPQPAAEAVPAPKKGWAPPEFDREWMKLVKYDEATERFIPAQPWVTSALADKVNAYQDFRRRDGERFFGQERPDMIWESIEDKIAAREEAFLQRIQQAEEQRQVQYQADLNAKHFFDERGKELFDFNAEGQPVRMTEQGKAFEYFLKQTYKQFQDWGIENPNPLHIQAQAINSYDGWVAQQRVAYYQQQAQPPAQPAPQGLPQQGAAPAQHQSLPPGVGINAAGVPYELATGRIISQASLPAPEPPPAPPTPSQRNQAHKEAFLGRQPLPPGAAHQPGNVVDASDSEPLTANGRQKSLMELAGAEFQKRGIQVGHN